MHHFQGWSKVFEIGWYKGWGANGVAKEWVWKVLKFFNLRK